MGRGFASGEVIALLKRLRLGYIIHLPRNRRVEAILAGMGSSLYWRGPFMVKGIETMLIVVRADRVGWVFATNMTLSEASEPIRLYRRRWNIETGHRCKGEARIKTKSLITAVRYFLLLLVALALYNLWELLPERPPLKRLIPALDEMEDEGQEGGCPTLELPLPSI